MQPLLLLHGAIGAKDQVKALATALGTHNNIQLLNFSGHGGEPAKGKFSIAGFAEEIRAFVEKNRLDKVDILGYSMGGYAAIYLALHHPEVVGKIVTLGTKFHWTEEIATKEVAMLNPDVIEIKVPKFAAQLQQRHHPADWKTVLRNTAEMLMTMGKEPPLRPEDFGAIKNDLLLLLGDRDKMVTLEETVQTYRQLPNAQFSVLPNTPHPIEMVDEKLVAYLVQRFLQS